MKLDLHGYTIHDAWKEFRKTTQDQYWKERKYIIVITGMGQMNMQFHHWVTNDHYSAHYEKLNDGAWKVYLKKKPSQAIKKEPEINYSGLLKKFRR